MTVYDDVFSDPLAYRAACLEQTFGSVSFGATTFHGIAQPCSALFDEWLEAHGRTPTLSFLRLSPVCQREPHYVHSDADMGTWTAIVYLNPDPPAEDGTRFWQHRASGERHGITVGADDGHDLSKWECWRNVSAAFNRCVVFDSTLFHSRSLLWNYGTGVDARLIHVAFGTE